MIVVTGASSFIGQHLIRSFSTDDELRFLIHESIPKHINVAQGIVPVKGDLLKPESLNSLIEPGCIVINLAFINRPSLRDNLDAITNLIRRCIEARIKRLVHCSTAVVVGDVDDNFVTEETHCNPRDEYETTKLQIEELLKAKAQGYFEVAILRPTAVFGPGGRNLLKLAGDLTRGNTFMNYLKSCLFGSRRMNLVYVDNVVAALLFLALTSKKMEGEIFIISDDEYPGNNYRDIETFLIKEFGCMDYPIPRIYIPPFLLSHMLRLAGRSNSNPDRIYSSRKIQNMGFREKTSFENGLTSFTGWYKKTHLSPTQKK